MPPCNWAEVQTIPFETSVLLDHIAEHLHSFALRSLPWRSEYCTQDDEAMQHSNDMVIPWLADLAAHDTVEDPDVTDGDDSVRFAYSSEAHDIPYFLVNAELLAGPDLTHEILHVLGYPFLTAAESSSDESVGASDIYFHANQYFPESVANSSAASAQLSTRSSLESDSSYSPYAHSSDSSDDEKILPESLRSPFRCRNAICAANFNSPDISESRDKGGGFYWPFFEAIER